MANITLTDVVDANGKKIPYGKNRQISVLAKATGYTNSALSNVVVYNSRPHINISSDLVLHITNCRAAATTYQLYNGETLKASISYSGEDGGSVDYDLSSLTFGDSEVGVVKFTVKGVGENVEDNCSKMLAATYSTEGGLKLGSTTLSENSPELIAAIAESGQASKYWNVGDEINIAMDGTDYTFVILGFNHDDKADGSGKAGVTFGMKNLYSTSGRYMNSSSDNSGGWSSSYMRNTVMTEMLAKLPAGWQNIIKEVSKKSGTGGGTTSGTQTTTDKLFLLSEREVFASRSYSVPDEFNVCEQYAYYRDIANTNALRVKKYSNGTGSAYNWWLRSPCSGNSGFFCGVFSDGSADYNYAFYSYGVSFGFCI